MSKSQTLKEGVDVLRERSLARGNMVGLGGNLMRGGIGAHMHELRIAFWRGNTTSLIHFLEKGLQGNEKKAWL